MSDPITEPTLATSPRDGQVVTRILSVVGKILVGAGVLLLLFTAFELWGTAVLEARSQAALRSQIAPRLPDHGAVPQAIKAPTGPPQVAPTTAPPALGQPIGTIIIPKIGVNKVILEGTRTQDLRQGPGHYPGTALPGQAGNAAIAGHRTTYAKPFYNLQAMAPGDLVFIVTPQGAFAYSVISVAPVAPTDVSVLAPSATPMLTLTTCNPRYSARQRLVLHAVLVRSVLVGSGLPAPPAAAPKGPSTTSSLAGSSTGVDWLLAIVWGIITFAVGLACVLVARRTRRPWLVYPVGGVTFLVVLFFFFIAVSPLVPASF